MDIHWVSLGIGYAAGFGTAVAVWVLIMNNITIG